MEAYWFEEAPAKNRFPVFTGSLEVDVAIIGGGIAGLTAAYFLAKSGLRIALFEQNFIASGESGYTTALLSHHLDNALDTRKTWTATQDALETIEKIAREERISCDFILVRHFLGARLRLNLGPWHFGQHVFRNYCFSVFSPLNSSSKHR